MKRTAISLLLALALVLCAVLVTAPQAQAADAHVCSDTHEGWTALTAAGGELATGNYYLAESITLTETITLAADATVTICLNGNTLTAPEDARTFNLSSDSAGATLKIYDHTGKTTGTITGGTNKNGGGNLYLNTSCTVELHSGTISNGTGNGTSGRGGNVLLNNAGVTFTMYGGTITGGSAGQRGGNIAVHNGNFVLEGGTITNASGKAGNNIQFSDNGKLNGTKLLDSLDAAVANGKVTIDGIVYMGKWNNVGDTGRVELRKLYGNVSNEITVPAGNKDLYLDLNGKTFAGAFGANTQAGGATLYVFDSTSDDFTTVAAGTYNGTLPVDGSLTKAANGVAIANLGNRRYLEINGTYQRFSLSIDAVSLELDANDNVDMGYSALIKGNSAVKGALSGFGIYVGKADSYENKQTLAKQAADFVAGAAGNKVTLRVNDVMTAGNNANKDADVKVQAFIKVGNTEIVGNDAVAYSVQDIVDAAAAATDGAATYPEFYALIEEIKTKYSITVTVTEAAA